MLRVIVYTFILLIAGCSGNQTPIMTDSPYSVHKKIQTKTAPLTKQVVSEKPASATDTATASIIPVKTHNFSGLVTITAQQRTISLCHNDNVFNLQPNQQLIEQIQRLNKPQAYIEFEGQLNQSLNKTHRRAVIKVDQLHYLSTRSVNKCTLTQSKPKFEIQGLEPTWNGIADNNSFTFTIKDSKSYWTIQKSVITKGLSAFVETQNSDGEQLDITFTGNGCIDSKNDYWQYETKIHVKNKEVIGCGQYPNQQYEDHRWLGHYLYSNKNVTIELELASNYQATVNYKYSNGKQITEAGYWHLFGSSGLKLLLTKRQGEKANVVFHFRRNGVRLQASQQWRNNIKHSFNGALLTLDRMTEEVKSTQLMQAEAVHRSFDPLALQSPTIATPAINRALKKYFTMHKSPISDTKYLYAEYDLNGNGKQDLIVLLDWCDNEGCVMLVFENRGNRYKFISRTTGVQPPIKISREQKFQWQSLSAKQNNNWGNLPFDGISYPASLTESKPVLPADLTQVNLITNALTGDWGIPLNESVTQP
jgi:putative lipoprotein